MEQGFLWAVAVGEHTQYEGGSSWVQHWTSSKALWEAGLGCQMFIDDARQASLGAQFFHHREAGGIQGSSLAETQSVWTMIFKVKAFVPTKSKT